MVSHILRLKTIDESNIVQLGFFDMNYNNDFLYN